MSQCWKPLKGKWVSRETQADVVAFVQKWQAKTGYEVKQFADWLGISRNKYYSRVNRQGIEHQPNGVQPKHHWLTEAEKSTIVNYYTDHLQTGYRRLACMMLDENAMAESPSSVYRLLSTGGLLRPTMAEPSKKGQGFKQPKQPHRHWLIDITYLNISGTFCYLCTILDGYSRFITHWEIYSAMKESDVETIVQRAREKFPQAKPRLISDNGSQFIARDFKNFVRLCGMQHVRTSPYYPQSNGKIERWHQTLKRECIRPSSPLSLADAERIVAVFVDQYNHHRLHSAIGYIAPSDKLNHREVAIFDQRRHKLAQARRQRKLSWQQAESH